MENEDAVLPAEPDKSKQEPKKRRRRTKMTEQNKQYILEKPVKWTKTFERAKIPEGTYQVTLVGTEAISSVTVKRGKDTLEYPRVRFLFKAQHEGKDVILAYSCNVHSASIKNKYGQILLAMNLKEDREMAPKDLLGLSCRAMIVTKTFQSRGENVTASVIDHFI